jgi:hypothetical protein
MLVSKELGVLAVPSENVSFLALVVGALSSFAAVLAYADWATSRVMRASADTKLPTMNAARSRLLSQRRQLDGGNYVAAHR